MSGDTVDWKTIDFGAMDYKAQTDLFRRARESLANDRFRPAYHFSPPGVSLHDAAGLCWWKGNYHLFYLFATPDFGGARGHAVSSDLVHWRDLPLVRHTIRGGTGQVWVDDDRAILGYATHKHKAVSLATASDPLLQEWVPHPQNPVYTSAPPPNGDLRPLQAGDNYLWREDDAYYMTIRRYLSEPGPMSLTGTTALEICRSTDLESWESMGKLFDDGHHTEPGEDCGCNNFLPIGSGKHLLLFFSHKRSAQYYIGTFDRETLRFQIEHHGRMNYGPVERGSLHAPSGFVDPSGRCIGIWNIMEGRTQEGWDQLVSLPRHLSLNEGGSDECRYLNPLRIEPIAELEALRSEPMSIEAVTVAANSDYILPGVEGTSMELEAIIDPMSAREVGINVLRSPGAEEQTTISLFRHSRGWYFQRLMFPNPHGSAVRELGIDVSRGSLDPAVLARPPELGPLYLEEGEPLKLRIFIDRSVVEVFANGHQCLTVRVYPSREDSRGVSVFARGSEAKVISLTAYHMQSIWPEL